MSFTKRFAAVAMAAGLALGAAACESDDTTDPAQEAPADDLGTDTEGDLGTDTEGELGTDDGADDLGGTETEGTDG